MKRVEKCRPVVGCGESEREKTRYWRIRYITTLALIVQTVWKMRRVFLFLLEPALTVMMSRD